MKNLYRFLVRNYFFFLFVLLEIISFTILFQQSYYHRASYFNYSQELTSNFNLMYDNIVEYFSLRKHNRQLAQENAKLRSLLKYSWETTDKNIFYQNDTLYRRKYEYINAKVINNSIHHRNNYITINKGSVSGITTEMAIINDQGVVGIIKDVSNNYATARSILHKDVAISAKFKKNNHVGSLVWNGKDYRIGTLKDVPIHVNVAKGDTIITSGYSSIFPEGIPIGVVTDFESIQGENFYLISVKYFVDFNNLSHVYVVRNIYKEEQSQLERLNVK